RGIGELSNVLPSRIRSGAVRTDACSSVRVVVQRLDDSPAGIGHDVRAAEVVRVDEAGLSRAGGCTARGLLVHSGNERIAIEDVLCSGRVFGSGARRGGDGVPLERI